MQNDHMVNKMDFNSKYDFYLKAVEKKIDEYFTPDDVLQKNVLDAMWYAITAGGKRVRPVLTIAAAELCGGDLEDAVSVALSVECIHNYSLVHDDMPCMDDDDLRRGRATCHKVFGEDIALLAGDGLLNSAFEILSDRSRYKTIGAEELLEATRCLSFASGVYGMIGGQVVDLECEKKRDVTLDELTYLHSNKTGALIRAAVKCGCISAGKEKAAKYIDILDVYAEKLGMAFQIKDDILDVEGDEKLLGKPIGSDEKSGKSTFVSILGMDKAKEYHEKCTNDAKEALKPLGDKGKFFSDLADFLLGRSF